MKDSDVQLPKALPDGLTLRWATKADVDALAEFNVRIHSDNANEPEEFLGYWTRDLMAGQHPTTNAEDFTVVVDENEGGKIVSSMNLISQTWAYDGRAFGVGRPELVGTDENYRRRGLVRAQFAAIHAKSAARGELLQGITGISWYYRQFGYEMCVNLGGSRHLYLDMLDNNKKVESEKFQIRPSTGADIPLLAQLYAIHCRGSLLARVRDEAQFRFECFQANRASPYARNMVIIESNAGQTAGYLTYFQSGQLFGITEIAAMPGFSLRALALFVVYHLKAKAEEMNDTRDKPINRIHFSCGAGHPVFEAIDRELDKGRRPYTWYIRVPDLAAFLLYIHPVLEKRLAASVMAGFSGETRLNFYRSQLALVWQQGKLEKVRPYKPAHFYDYGAAFPDLTFLQLLFGHRSLAALDEAFADVYVPDADTAVLLSAIFPQQDSWISALG